MMPMRHDESVGQPTRTGCRSNLEEKLSVALGLDNAAAFASEFVAAVASRRREIEFESTIPRSLH
jgi:hypothetical protein